MDYKKLVKDLLLGCQENCENCENCEYSDLIEFNCTIDKVAADVILELLIENKILDKKNSDLQVRTESAEARCNMLEKMVKEYQEVIVPGYAKRIEQVKQERDAAISDLERAEKIAEETYTLLNNKIQPVFDYSVYTAIHDSVTDIISWEKENIWREN